jgi:hypothetical protein
MTWAWVGLWAQIRAAAPFFNKAFMYGVLLRVSKTQLSIYDRSGKSCGSLKSLPTSLTPTVQGESVKSLPFHHRSVKALLAIN